MSKNLIEPHGGSLVDPLVDRRRAAELKAASRDWPSWDLTPRQLSDLELLLNGGFSPLRGFMARQDYESVRDRMRLADGTLWPIPVTLDIPEPLAQRLAPGARLALRDPEGVLLAALQVEEVFRPDLEEEARRVYGTNDLAHPGVRYLLEQSRPYYVGGLIEGIQPPEHYDFRSLRSGPAAVRREFAESGWQRVVAFQTRNPMHRAHFELTLRAMHDVGANLFIQPVAGPTKPGDLDHYARVHCYQSILPRYPKDRVKLSLLPLAMRMAGPREALWHAIIRKNYGCTHLIVGRDHAGPGNGSDGRAFYGPYDAQELLRLHEEELGVRMVPFGAMVYVEDQDAYFTEHEIPAGTRARSLSGTELRQLLANGIEIPEWFTFPEVAAALREHHPPRHRQGLAIFLTGLSGAGKSTIANVLRAKLLEINGRPVTLLDGDLVRKHLSSELGFTKEHRDINIRRIGFVAAEIAKNGGIAICAPIAPYDGVRREVRRMVCQRGAFFLVHVDTPLEVCEQRDRKGLYAKARAGLIPEFTGISDPYETPADAEVVVRAAHCTPQQCAAEILQHLEREGYLRRPSAVGGEATVP